MAITRARAMARARASGASSLAMRAPDMDLRAAQGGTAGGGPRCKTAAPQGGSWPVQDTAVGSKGQGRAMSSRSTAWR